MRCLPQALCAVLLLAVAAVAQARDERTAAVGMRAYIEQIVLPGSEIVVGPVTREDPVAVRIVKTWPHGSTFRYDLEWTGLEPGKHDLRAHLVRKDGSSLEGVPTIVVEARPTLAANVREPSEPDPLAAPRLSGYRTLQIVFGVLWVVGLLAILLLGRKRKTKATPIVAKVTLADRLRPLVESVAAGRADTAAQAELERLLVSYWRLRLGLREMNAATALTKIRNHPEAGALLRQVELWLHAPARPTDLDLGKLLQPYRSVTAASLLPIAEEAVN